MAACSGTSTPGSDVVDHQAVVDGTGVDAMRMDALADAGLDVASDLGQDSLVTPDAQDAPDVATDGGGVPACQTCTTDADCGMRGRCVQLSASTRVCLETCNPDVPTCPGSFSCVMNFTLATVPLCTPVGGPCCIDADGDGYGVGVGCTAMDCNDHDPAVHGGTPEVCNGLDDNCNGLVDDGLGSTTCGLGACANTVPACLGGVTQTCTPRPGSAEVCNGVDDNCNGSIDEGLGSTSCGIGACQTTTSNCVGGTMRTCTPGAGSPEVCGNGIDDDCDGTVDNGCVTCAPASVRWNIPAGTSGGPTCITTGGGYCVEDVTCTGSSCRGGGCGQPHCGTLYCNSGTYMMPQYCSVIATCTSSGTIATTGFTW